MVIVCVCEFLNASKVPYTLCVAVESWRLESFVRLSSYARTIRDKMHQRLVVVVLGLWQPGLGCTMCPRFCLMLLGKKEPWLVFLAASGYKPT